MNILITGGTGFVGKRLVNSLKDKAFANKVFVITRDPQMYFNDQTEQLKYITTNDFGQISEEIANSVDVIVNLAGENISNARWSEKQKRKLTTSRVDRTQKLLKQFEDKQNLKKIISASAIGIYPTNKSNELTEESELGEGFLADLCKQWEAAVTEFNHPAKKCIMRIGVVFGKGGGALQKLWPIFKFGLGGPVGLGKQVMSWIHVDDLVKAIEHFISKPDSEGVYNLTSPMPVSNAQFSKAFAKAFGTPCLFPVPPIALKAAMGEMSTIVLDGQTILPKRLESEGFEFNHAQVEKALEHIVNT
ncbi:MAG: TIGR01777 family protein [Oligoflexia bacterium]|nr:TIGR01777 family protein [Oligoflexia bacterium]